MEDETVTRMRYARAGKMSHITRRMNIVNDLMTKKDFLEEVKENMTKFNEFLEEFKALHASYVSLLDETAREEDMRIWYWPKLEDIDSFIGKVSQWIVSTERPSSPSTSEVTSSANLVHDTAPAHEPAPPEHSHAQTDLDFPDTRSHRSSASSGRSHSSTRSLRINAEAEREALLVKASKLQQKHAVQDQEEILRKYKEALEISTELDATNAKINYLKAAEKTLAPIPFSLETTNVSVMEERAPQDVEFDEESLISFHGTPSVRPRASGAHVNFPLLNQDHSAAQLRPTSSSQVQYTSLPLSLPYGGEANISPVLPQLAVSAASSSSQDTLPTATQNSYVTQLLQPELQSQPLVQPLAPLPVTQLQPVQPPLSQPLQLPLQHLTQPLPIAPQPRPPLQPQPVQLPRQPQLQPQQTQSLPVTLHPQPLQPHPLPLQPQPPLQLLQPQLPPWSQPQLQQQQSQPQPQLQPQLPPQVQFQPQAQTPSLASSPHDSHLVTVLENQNELTKLLMRQQLSSTLPQGSISVFDGEVLEYKSFIHNFKNTIERKTDNCRDRLQYLIQYTKGQAQRLVKSCEYMEPDRGYEKALKLLKENFGNEYKISCAYLEKALSWPQIKPQDAKSLQEFAMFLRSCCNAMEEMTYREELDTISTMRSIAVKLPYKLREKWCNKAFELQQQRQSRVRILDLVSFMETQVRVAGDPMFGDLRDQPVGKGKANANVKTRPSKPSSSSFATSIAPVKGTSYVPSDQSCDFCSSKHALDSCQKFTRKAHRDKLSFLRSKGICYGCLTSGHISKDCSRRLICNVCRRNHPSSLHIATKETANPPESAAESCAHIGAGDNEGVLSIVAVKVRAAKGSHVIETYALLDPGSSATFCSEELMTRLNLTGKRTNILLRTMSQETSVPTYVVSGLEISALNSDTFFSLPGTLTQKNMPVTSSSIPKQSDLAHWAYLGKVTIPSICSKVELLIGTNAPHLLEPWEVINSQNGGPYAVRTLLGWVVNGPFRSTAGIRTSVTVNRISVEGLEKLIISQYNQDFQENASEEKTEMSVEDKRFLQMANEAVLENGHYSLKLPFRKASVHMPSNRKMAEQRLNSLKRKMARNDQFKQEYTAFITDFFDNNYAEEVPQGELQQPAGATWFLPHHGVYHPKKKKLRVVFDCAASFQGVSLNSELLPGPDLTNSLLGVIMRFRKEPIAVMADIKSMFHQVRVAKSDVDYLRFLWWPQGDTRQTPKEHRMLVHIFGAVSSPSIATYALQRTATDYESCFSPQVAETIRHNFYVDDCARSVAKESDAIQLVRDLTALCSKGGFLLTQWVSNSRAVLASIPQEHRAKDIKSLDLDKDSLPVERALGLQWSVDSDSFQFNTNLNQKPHTRRGILSVVSSVFDPLGFLAPLILPAKQLLQELCQAGYGWDEPLPQGISKRWMEWTSSLELVKGFTVPRCLKPEGFGVTRCVELHHFADASESGYGSVSYIRQVNRKHVVHVTFVLGKSRVLPLKKITVPRLELAAAALSVKVDRMLRRELHLDLEPSVFWTDSQTVLKYIANDQARFKTYVANRVSFIRDNTELSQWRYVGSKDNPADDASRGLNARKFMEQKRWMHAPDFLWKTQECWPVVQAQGPLLQGDPEVRKTTTVFTAMVKPETPTDQLIMYFSDWTSLLKAVAWYLKLKKALVLKVKSGKLTPLVHSDMSKLSPKLEAIKPLTVTDLADAERAVVMYVQRQAFPNELSTLQMTPPRVPHNSRLRRLDPVLEDGLLRVGGRLHRSAMPEETKHPCIVHTYQYCC
ncbi:uncharacterized protein LOC132901020 [Neoarius graeffei]|uniref:uncharacterized protein LOC132901020 n=1 Tax=Neoarius graeffei TaxID=443677 RepID=UPI00298D0DD3|nr:uncharacterized protein LOC132901020 [Neoarius graeffei]